MNLQRTLYLVFLLITLSSSCLAGELNIDLGKEKVSYSPDDLLKNPSLITLKNISLPTYPDQTFNLKAIPLCSLLKLEDKEVGVVLKVQASDKYISYFNLKRIYPCDKERASTAYLAIEEKDKPWPIVTKLKRSAGPFYLIWIGKKVAQTDWVFAVETISTTSHNPFSDLLPAKSTALQAQGLEIFASHCGVCHSINLIGNLEIGPDLNVPLNPTEYFSEKLLRQFIRNPQSLRYMKNDKMFAFTKDELSEQELDAVIAFLQLMREHKITVPTNRK